MVITEFLERNARLYGSDTALVELNPSHERDSAVTWREASRDSQSRRYSRSFEFPLFRRGDQILSGTCGRRSIGIRTGIYQPHGYD